MNDDAVMVERDGEDRYETVGNVPVKADPEPVRYDTHRLDMVLLGAGFVVVLLLSKILAGVLS